MFRKILIANRGEIAVRIARACRELDVSSVAIFSEADRGAFHVRFADEAHPCGPPPARESYLSAERVLEIARSSGADAIHPGYGFLSENGDFADLCAKAGIPLIGPRGDVVRAMGDKVAARRVMAQAGIPIVPGATEALSDDEALHFARDVGFPVMVKACAGGGGRGMRVVAEERQLAKALARARSEAASSFADDSVYIEKLLEAPRHIEIQFLADAQGRILHLFERECSIQRRYQKLVEEAPGNRISAELRARMGQASVDAARSLGYVGAGTCEFLVDRYDDFYFLEMNTRLQVEHPVTEAVTGVDIVKTGIRVASGEPLAPRQEDIRLHGHAIEARIYAEDPDRRFLPCPGDVTAFRAPDGFGVRVDAGVEAGSRVTVHYDPLIAKLVAWGSDRPEAIERLRRALDEFEVEGIKTSIPFHRRVVRHPAFVEGRYDTAFVETHLGSAR